VLPGAQLAALDRRVRATGRRTRAAAEHKTRIKDLARPLRPASPPPGRPGAAEPPRSFRGLHLVRGRWSRGTSIE